MARKIFSRSLFSQTKKSNLFISKASEVISHSCRTRRIFAPLNRYGCPNIKPNLFRTKFCKKIPQAILRRHFKPIQILLILQIFLRGPSVTVGRFQFHLGAQYIFVPVFQKKLWVCAKEKNQTYYFHCKESNHIVCRLVFS